MKDESFDSDIMYILYIMLGFFVLIVLRRFLMNKISEYLTKKENVIGIK